MRTRTPISFIAVAALALGACGEDPPAKDPSSAKDSGEKAGGGGGDKGGGGGGSFTCKGKADVGKAASPFTMESMNNAGKLAVEPGKVTLVDFWATWCGPCEKSFPKYQDLYVKYKASGLELVAISLDDETKDIPNFIKSTGIKFPVGWDGAKKVPPCFDIQNMPTAYIVDRKGVVRFVHRGYRANEE